MSDPRRDLPMHEAQHSFDVVLRGYDRSQVADTIERLEADFRIALADRDAAVARTADMASQLSALHGEIESLRRKAATAAAPTFENISERIQHMLQLAEEEAGEIRRAAEADAMAVREQTAAEERALLERHAAGQAEVERMIAEARQTAEQIAQKAQIRADELVAKAQERVARLDAESQARRAKVEEDFDIAQRARRAEAARVEEERERVSTQAARQRIAAAEQHAAQLVAEGEARAEAIREVRDELTGRLVQARRLLDGLPDLSDRAQQARDDADADRRAVASQAPAKTTEPSAPEPAAASAEPAVPPQAAQPTTAPAAPAAQPAAQSPAPVAGPQTGQQPAVQVNRGESEAAAARQPTRPDPVTATFPAPTPQRSGEPTTRQLPLPSRQGSTTGSTPGSQSGSTQEIDQPVGQGRS
ncbi:hypothetical protein GCU60_11410 [Blastococcus saxobsidens]|uniref:DivIVA domain-containing protein n=1 Tax=Blastococcus saxobsidens TaxID=138336 RepID=A0A6L9W4F9_9ACTN|nr:hypothetical protein [Blastococcus saxobsidens]NEK86361.1 hypothetical protein [Blastococcus saxobsidens]